MPSWSVVRHSLSANWFFLILPFLLAISFAFSRSVDWGSSAAAAEAVTLFDWVVTVPLLYFLCYRKSLGRKHMAVRLVALACLGIWLAGRLVPAEAQNLLVELGWARSAGIAVLILIELRIFAAALKFAFSSGAKAEDLEKTGVPPLLAKFMLIEARFWRAVWRFLRGR